MHICFQGLSLGPCTKREKSKTCKEITKAIQERSLSAYIRCEQAVQLEQRGVERIWGIDHIAFLTSKAGANLDRKLPLLGGLKIWLCSFCILYTNYRQYLPQGNTHWWCPQHPCEGNLQDTFCDSTLTNLLQSEEYMQPKSKDAVVPTPRLPH